MYQKASSEIFLKKIKDSLQPLVGGRVKLSPLCEQDLPFTLSWRNRDDIRVHFKTSDIITRENHLAWWKNYRHNFHDFVFTIQETAILKKKVGQISIYNLDLGKGEAEFGRLMIGEMDARGKGLAKEAISLLIKWAFSLFGLNRIYLEVLKSNTGAIGLYRDCGFAICAESDNTYIMQIFVDKRGITEKDREKN